MAQHFKKQQKTVLITGCSDGGLGAALATSYHRAGYRVLATARNLSKMAAIRATGIETLSLDVLSDESISACVSEVGKLTGGTLDVLVNNAGAGYNMSISDMSIPEAKKLFDLNVWSYIAIIQAFLPLLMRAKDGALVVNQTSVGSVSSLPFQSIYNASKSAVSMFSESLRLELKQFNISVVDLKTGGVKSNFLDNMTYIKLPANSIYATARDDVNKMLSGETVQALKARFPDADVWADEVVKDLTKSNPPYQVWRGAGSWVVWLSTFLPIGLFDERKFKLTGMDIVNRKMKEAEANGATSRT